VSRSTPFFRADLLVREVARWLAGGGLGKGRAVAGENISGLRSENTKVGKSSGCNAKGGASPSIRS
jgi:hypothetical protein